MSDFTVTVTANETFTGNSTPITRAMLQNAATPQVSLTGTISNSDISNGTITGAKIAADAAIAHTKLNVTQGSIPIGHTSGATILLHPDTSVTGAFAAGGFDAGGSRHRARFVVSRGTNPNTFACLGTDISTVGGDVKIDVSNDRLKAEIETGKVEGIHLQATIGGQSSTPSNDQYNDSPTIGVNGQGTADAYLKVLDNSITVKQLAHAASSSYYGGIIAYTSDGSPAQIEGGTAGQILTSRGQSNPTYQSLYTTFNLGDALDGSGKGVRVKHGLGYTPKDLKLYIKCKASAAANTQWYEAGDIVYPIPTNGDFEYNLSSNGEHIFLQQNQTFSIFEKAIYGVDTTSDNVGTAVQFNVSGDYDDWVTITPSNWSLHVIAR